MDEIDATITEMCDAHEGFHSLQEEYSEIVDTIKSILSMRARIYINKNKTGMGSLNMTDLAAIRLMVERVLDPIVEEIPTIIGKFGRSDADLLIAKMPRDQDSILALQAVPDKALKLEPNCDRKCRKCDKQRVFFHDVQTRSSDEASTIFYLCLECDHVWTS